MIHQLNDYGSDLPYSSNDLWIGRHINLGSGPRAPKVSEEIEAEQN